MIFQKIILKFKYSKTIFQRTVLECLFFKKKLEKVEDSKMIFGKIVLEFKHSETTFKEPS